MTLLQIISHYTQLQRSGNEYKGKCPLCGQAGFRVSTIWRCLSCGEQGCGADFIIKSADLIAGRARKPKPEGLTSPHWERITPPSGSYPPLGRGRISWGKPYDIKPEVVKGIIQGYRLTYPNRGPMIWIYVQAGTYCYWKVRWPPILERVKARCPEATSIVARIVAAGIPIPLQELIPKDQHPMGIWAHAIAHAFKQHGWRARYLGKATQRRKIYVNPSLPMRWVDRERYFSPS
jgi:hypothetical protein